VGDLETIDSRAAVWEELNPTRSDYVVVEAFERLKSPSSHVNARQSIRHMR